MKIRDWRNKRIAEDPEFRKAWYDLQWDTNMETAHQMFMIQVGAGLTQEEFAKKTGIVQPAISRAENYGCSLQLLQRAAKAVGVVIKLHIEKERPLNPTYNTDSTSSQTGSFEFALTRSPQSHE